ncbi:NHLP leader peptide family RiPP precursor [Arcicella sp. LKC2W]|uniref:NHLP leader peptide family RiPP precursor n=1 Tax=Arcicella sp. LKC2W TaxID=2984198 RepID=UPI002B21F563|nr:NHLP leader peptide family RiPP precursor [Arcicella sp. LKC2W]MEA5461117.1 NHLP leader peptide family RiPP precursor [Arcicella sp. LKC2W]
MEQRKQKIIQTVISKAWEDSNFRKELIADPVTVIEKLSGVKIVLPEGKTLVIADQTDKSKVYLTIPAEPEMENMELTEEQLESIAGGGKPIWNDLVKNLFPALQDYIKI